MNNESPPADHAFVDADKSENAIEDNLKSSGTWLRLLFMLVSCVLAGVAVFAGTVVVILGFFHVLITGEVRPEIKATGQSIATYLYDISRFLTYNSETKPFPLGGEWPSGEAGE